MGNTEQLDFAKTIKSMYLAGDYHGVLALVQDINTEKVKDRRALEMIADSYDKSGLYNEAREHLLMAYERYPGSRHLAYKLAVISVKVENLDDAVDFYEDFCRLAPHDNSRFILKYLIGRAGGIDVKDLIKVLEQYNELESDEKWLYELARLYHECGRVDECVALCDEIALWYAGSEYEKLALELKFTHKSLSSSQQARYEQIMRGYAQEAEEAQRAAAEEAEKARLEAEAETFVSEFSGLSAFPPGGSEDEAAQTQPLEAEGAYGDTQKLSGADGSEKVIETFRLPAQEIKAQLEREGQSERQSEAASGEMLRGVGQETPAHDAEAYSGKNVYGDGGIVSGAKKMHSVEETQIFKASDISETARAAEETDAKGGPAQQEQKPLRGTDAIIEIEPQEKEALSENITFRLPVDVINAIMEESRQESREKAFSDILMEAADERRRMQEQKMQPEKEKEEKQLPEPACSREDETDENRPELNEEGKSMDIALAKLGVETIEKSSKAVFVRKPPLNNTGFVEEPVLKENVDASAIPIDSEFDGQAGINLNLLSREGNDDIDGQITIDEFFREYAGRVEQHRDAVAAVEAERVRRIAESVKDMEIRKPDEADFDAPEKEDFSEEEVMGFPSDAGVDDFIVINARELSEEDLLSDEPLRDETEDAGSEQGSAPEEAEGGNNEEAGSGGTTETEEDSDGKEEVRTGEKEETGSEEGGITGKETGAEADETQAAQVQEESGEKAEGKNPAPETAAGPEAAKDASVEASQAAGGDELHAGTGDAAAAAPGAHEEADMGEDSALPEDEAQAAESGAGPEEEETSVSGTAEEAAQEKTAQSAEDESDEAEEGVLTQFAQYDPSTEETPLSAQAQRDTGSLEAALADFENRADSTLDEADKKDLFAFGDDLADIITYGSPGKAAKHDPFVISPEFRREIREFLLIDGIEEEIRSACETIAWKKLDGDPSGGNLIITGDKKCGKTYLAISVIKAVIKAVGTGSGKVVKVQAQPLNGKNMHSVLKKVDGRDLIIENVGYLNDETIQDLFEVIKSGEASQMIILEGNSLAVENIIMHFPETAQLFSSRINIQELTITQWAQVAKEYAAAQGYTIDDMADLALHARIDRINVPSVRLGMGDIRDIVDSAIAKSTRRNNGKFFAAFSNKRKEKIALTESDFLE